MRLLCMWINYRYLFLFYATMMEYCQKPKLIFFLGKYTTTLTAAGLLPQSSHEINNSNYNLNKVGKMLVRSCLDVPNCIVQLAPTLKLFFISKMKSSRRGGAVSNGCRRKPKTRVN